MFHYSKTGTWEGKELLVSDSKRMDLEVLEHISHDWLAYWKKKFLLILAFKGMF